MSRKPGSMAGVARILRVTVEGIRKAIEQERVGVGLRERVVEWLADHDVIRDATIPDLLDRYGPEAERERWTTERLLHMVDKYPERQIAKRQALAKGLPVDSIARVCTRPPWVSREYRGRNAAWWSEEMRRAAEVDAARKPVPPHRVAEMVREDFEVLRRVG